VILTVTLNPAWDITHTVQRLEPGTTHRPDAVAERPGGKGVNVSRVLHQLGHPTLATGFAAGATGRRLRAELAGAGIREAFFGCDAVDQSTVDQGTVDQRPADQSSAQTRRTLTIVEADTGRATVLAEPGPASGSVDWAALLDHLDSLIADADVVVLSGSLPAAVPPDAYRTLVHRAHAHDVPVIVDADSTALVAALDARPDLVKPNSAELGAATGHRDPVTGGRRLLDAGAVGVVVSDGPAGLTVVTANGVWRAVPAALRPVNPTGAGDAAVAALAVGLAERRDWPELLRTAVAWSAAAVLEPCAGAVAADRIGELADSTTVTAIAARTATPLSTAMSTTKATATDRSVPQC
jgi:tagatose 6-phosphate kinase